MVRQRSDLEEDLHPMLRQDSGLASLVQQQRRASIRTIDYQTLKQEEIARVLRRDRSSTRKLTQPGRRASEKIED